jgi:cytoskeletal protein RodZ
MFGIGRPLLLPGFIGAFVGQLGLFGVLWWQNSKRIDQLNVDRAAHSEQDRRSRRERVRQAHEQADRDKGNP